MKFQFTSEKDKKFIKKISKSKTFIFFVIVVLILSICSWAPEYVAMFIKSHPAQIDWIPGAQFEQQDINKLRQEVENNQTNNVNYVLSLNLREMGVTDVFYGHFYSRVNDGNSTNDPGQRFVVNVQSVLIGNAMDNVVVNDSNNTYKSLSKMGERSPDYIFYTKYDAKNKWYDIVKAVSQETTKSSAPFDP